MQTKAAGMKMREGEALNSRLKTLCWVCCRLFKKARWSSGFANTVSDGMDALWQGGTRLKEST